MFGDLRQLIHYLPLPGSLLDRPSFNFPLVSPVRQYDPKSWKMCIIKFPTVPLGIIDITEILVFPLLEVFLLLQLRSLDLSNIKVRLQDYQSDSRELVEQSNDGVSELVGVLIFSI